MLVRAQTSSGGGGGNITFSEAVAPLSNNTATLTVDGKSDAYIVNTMTDATAYWSGCNITSVVNGTATLISEATYGADKAKTWSVYPTTKGSTVTINFGLPQAFKWITAVNC